MPSPQLQAACAAAAAAAPIIRSFYGCNLPVRSKQDASPVTEADIRAERAIRDVLHERFPNYGFYGEETGRFAMQAENIWLVDPIDGTKSFVRQCPFFSTQIALMCRGELVLGVSNAPLYGELAWAEKGSGAFLNDRPVHVSDVATLGASMVSTGNLGTLARSASWGRLADLIGRVDRIRGYGDFLHYHLLARGAIDVVIESDVHVLDVAALSVIVSCAGGTFTDLSGRPVGLDTTSVLATNGFLHPDLLGMFAGVGTGGFGPTMT